MRKYQPGGERQPDGAGEGELLRVHGGDILRRQGAGGQLGEALLLRACRRSHPEGVEPPPQKQAGPVDCIGCINDRGDALKQRHIRICVLGSCLHWRCSCGRASWSTIGDPCSCGNSPLPFLRKLKVLHGEREGGRMMMKVLSLNNMHGISGMCGGMTHENA